MTDAEKATAYARIAATMRTDAQTYSYLAATIEPRPELLTFAQPYAAGLGRYYDELARFCSEAAEQAQTIADDYAARVDGTYERLVPTGGAA